MHMPASAAHAGSPPRILVIIVSYRSAALVIECLRSVHAERSRTHLEIAACVVDNASGDFPEVARAVEENGWSSWVTVLLAPRNGGFAYGNNLAIRHAFGTRAPDYVHLLNPDTQVRPGAIAALSGFLEDRPEAGIAGSSFENEDGSDWPIAFRFPNPVSEFSGALGFGPLSRLLQRWAVARCMGGVVEQADWVSGASLMIRSEVLRAIGGLDENFFLYFEETDFCYRARQAGFTTWYVPASRVMHIAGQTTKVMERNAAAKRLPECWFESRRRYFALRYGRGRASAIDVVVLLTYPLGWLKRLLQGKTHSSVPHYLRDLWHYSILQPRNRNVGPLRAPQNLTGEPC